MLDSIRTMLPPEEAELLAGVLLGRTDRLAESINDDFRTVGFSHVLSVSGLHMAIISQLMLGISHCLPASQTFCRRPNHGWSAVLYGFDWVCTVGYAQRDYAVVLFRQSGDAA